MPNVYSIGYQRRSVDMLCEMLLTVGATTLVDVRLRAWSHRPEFRKTALMHKLANAGLAYVHCRDVGNPFRPRIGEAPSFEACAELYREHLRSSPAGLSLIRDLVLESPVALFCYEKETCDCHRSILIDELCGMVEGLQHIPL